MEFNDFQDAARETAVYPENEGVAYTALGLASEAGEYAGKVKRRIRDGWKEGDNLEAIDELGDALWYIAMSAFELGFDLNEVASRNIRKLSSRQERGVLQGAGDNR